MKANYEVHIRDISNKFWRFCKRFNSYDYAYDFIVSPKTYMYNSRYDKKTPRYFRISYIPYNLGIFNYYDSDYYACYPCVLDDGTYEFNHIIEVSYEDVLSYFGKFQKGVLDV